MASFSATSLRFQSSLKPSSSTSQASSRTSSLRAVSVGWTRSRRSTPGFHMSCAAQPETVEKVYEIVRKQLALPPESKLTPETKFSALGADFLDCWITKRSKSCSVTRK